MDKRTTKQNKSIHKYFELLSRAFQDAGLDARVVLKPEVEIPLTPIMVKDLMWKPVQEIMLKKKSTTQLTTAEVNSVYEVIQRHVAEKHGIHVDFPSDEEAMLQNLDYE